MTHLTTVRPRSPRRAPHPRTPTTISALLGTTLALTATACIPDNPTPPREAPQDTTTAALAPDTTADVLAAATTADVLAAATTITVPVPDPAPPTTPPVLDRETALVLALMFSCVDRPHALPASRSGYLTEMTYTRRPGFERDRAFYGCSDWHSAVNTTWAMVRLMKERPEFPASPVLREKLETHLSESTMAGELAYLTDNPAFERPYGWAWLLLLHAELETWSDPEAAEWVDHIDPLADLLAERMADYLGGLEEPVRMGWHPNTAFAISMSLRATAMVRRPTLERTLRSAATRFFGGERECPVDEEPGSSDFLSPCLEEAALMASVMQPNAYVRWLDSHLPPIDSEKFAPLRTSALSDSTRRFRMSMPTGGMPAEFAEALNTLMQASQRAMDSIRQSAVDRLGRSTGGDSVRAGLSRVSMGARSHLIGLSFSRAEAMLRIADALPAGDPRVARLRELAAQHGRSGFETMFDAGYFGSHWLGSFALKYLVESARGTVP